MSRAERAMLKAARTYREYRSVPTRMGRIMRALARRRLAFWNWMARCDVLPGATIGERTVFPHPGGVVIHQDSIIGDDCMIMQQVTIGQLADGAAPVIGNGVYIGAGARILGGVRIGDGARIGANAVVLNDVAPGHVAVGVPARSRPI